MAKEDLRKLKDDVADFLKKQKWEKAADTLEKLVKAEPKEMTHRLKLGDTYRRLDQVQKAVACYQHAAKFFADEGQLIKAIGAVKVILELDPKNADAQKHLGEMNEQRFAKPTLESVGLKPARGIGAGARATSAIELEQGSLAADAVGAAVGLHDHGALELDPGEEPSLELDQPGRGGPPRRGFQGVQTGRVPLSRQRSSFDLGGDTELDPATLRPRVPGAEREPELEAEALPDDAILEPSPEELASSPHDDDVAEPGELTGAYPLMPDEEPTRKRPGGPPRPGGKAAAIAPPPPPAVSRRPPPSAISVSDEISIEDEPVKTPAPGRKPEARPIADLLSSDAEEEIELLSISTDEELGGRPIGAPVRSLDESDLDQAFGKIAPEAAASRSVPVKRVPLFDDLSQEAFVELVNKVKYHRHAAGQLILREGDAGRSFFVIVEGKVRIYKTASEGEITLATLGEGAFFGEMALLSGAPRTANVVAEDETELLEVSDVVLRDLAHKYPQVVDSLKKFYRQRLLNNVMAISPLFKDFDPAERKAIVEKFRMKQAKPGDVLIREGTNSDGLYVVLHGAVEVAVRRGESAVPVARLREGDVFGEISLLTRKPATATVTAAGKGILLRLPRENFQELVLTHPQILELVSTLSDQRRSATDAILQGQGPGHDGMSYV